MMPEVGKATVRLLRRLGVDVDVPLEQTCCGQMHINTGYAGQALPLVQHHTDAFRGYDAVVTPSGSCAGSVRHQHPWLAERSGSAALQADVADLAGRTYELSEFLIDVLGVVATDRDAGDAPVPAQPTRDKGQRHRRTQVDSESGPGRVVEDGFVSRRRDWHEEKIVEKSKVEGRKVVGARPLRFDFSTFDF